MTTKTKQRGAKGKSQSLVETQGQDARPSRRVSNKSAGKGQNWSEAQAERARPADETQSESATIPEKPSTPLPTALQTMGVEGDGQHRGETHVRTANPSTSTNNRDAAETGHAMAETQTPLARSAAIAALREFQAQRVMCIRQMGRIGSAAKAMVRRILGWNCELPEKQRNAINRRATAIVKTVFAGKVPTGDDAEQIVPAMQFLMTARSAYGEFESLREKWEKQMRGLAVKLPAAKWVESERGIAIGGFATIVGEAGDLSRFRTPGGLWKRFGLHVVQGKAPSSLKGKDLTAGEWQEVGYSPRRRSIMYAQFESMLKAGGVYKEIYDQRKTYELGREGITKLHAHRRAMRYATKRFLLHLWVVWRKEAGTYVAPEPQPTVEVKQPKQRKRTKRAA